MTEELKKKLNTAGSFDGPWLKNQFQNWNVNFEQQKTDFMEHMYQVYQPGNDCYTGLWKQFCLTEAGPYCRNQYFHALVAIEEFESKKQTL